MVIAGVMSGSSLDGLDIAFIEFNDNAWSILDAVCLSYSSEWEDRIREYYKLTASEYIDLKYSYSHYIGELLNGAFLSSNVKPDYISFHGHTIVHAPQDGYTEQIGNGGIIAGLTGVSTITDFRSQDVALGGVGTPLAPYLDHNFITGYDYYLNLGGIANVTSVNKENILAYDICPCNQVLNYFSAKKGLPYDDQGKLASEGIYNPDVASYFSDFKYFEKSPPKSLDNNWIREVFIEGIPADKPENILRTYCVWMAGCIADQVKSGRSTVMYSTGGGSLNTFFISELKKALEVKKCKLEIPNREMIDYKEAVLMAVLGKSYLDNRPNVMSQVTGALKDSIGGALYKVLDI